MNEDYNRAPVERFVMRLRQRFCKHIFRGPDMQLRDNEGMVNWLCSKCGKMFREPYGLAMGDYGTITGPWGEPHNAEITGRGEENED
jgi:hypothetical protein